MSTEQKTLLDQIAIESTRWDQFSDFGVEIYDAKTVVPLGSIPVGTRVANISVDFETGKITVTDEDCSVLFSGELILTVKQ